MGIKFTQKETVAMYIDGGWDLIEKQKDTPLFRSQAKQIINAGNTRYRKLNVKSAEEGLYSPALEATKAGKIGQKTGAFSVDFSNIQKVKSEMMRAIKFLDDTTSTVTGARKNADESRKRVFAKWGRGQTKEEEIARWDCYNYFRKNNPEIIARKGEVGGWIDSDKILKWIQEYRTMVGGGAQEFMDYLGDKISDELGIPKDVLDLSIPEKYR